MTIARAFADYMQDVLELGTFNTDIFIGTVPEGAPVKSWWILSSGGTPIMKNKTGEKQKNYLLSVFLRDIDPENVDTLLQDLEWRINGKHCDGLEGYETIELEATGFQSDQDLDSEDRTVGLLQITATVYQSD